MTDEEWLETWDAREAFEIRASAGIPVSLTDYYKLRIRLYPDERRGQRGQSPDDE